MRDLNPVPLGPDLPPPLKGKGIKGFEGMNEDGSDGEESRDEGANGDLVSSSYSDAQSLDARSCGEGISKKEA
ncbi:hypothetical protein Tco_1435855, partial [Tanacetum coccineum]